jgi:hypothetical protein
VRWSLAKPWWLYTGRRWMRRWIIFFPCYILDSSRFFFCNFYYPSLKKKACILIEYLWFRRKMKK